MLAFKNSYLQYRYFRSFDLLICLPFIAIPLFIDLPYRVNIFLSWEGAYRLYIGQMPFEDFGLPMGFGYWLIPTLFFKIFGPSMASLVKAQVLINVIWLLSIRGILYNLKIKPVLVSLTLLITCLTYVIYNFWPWYNHSVVVFEMAGFFFVTEYVRSGRRLYKIMAVFLSAFFMFLSFFTKQDVGALGFMMGLLIIVYASYRQKELWYSLVFFLSFLGIGILTTLPFLNDGFFYWFNYGQPPHNPRLNILYLIDSLLTEATWEKIYLSLFVLLLLTGRDAVRSILKDPHKTVLTIISLGMIGQAIITRVTSPLPTDHMTYFHAFAVVLLASLSPLNFSADRVPNAVALALIALFCFSPGYWKYLSSRLPIEKTESMTGQHAGNGPWIPTTYPGFEKVTMPQSTAAGIERLLQSPVAQKKNLQVLNMTELTPLALNLDYDPPVNQPLWYHLNVGIFQKEVDAFCKRVKEKEYDLVLFEDIPSLNNFYPYQVRDTLYKYYIVQDKFLAPRKLEDSWVEVFVRE